MRPCAPRSPTRCSASTRSSPRRSRRSCWRRRRRGRWATSPAPSPSSWPAACARRRAPSPPRSSPRSARSPASARPSPRRTATSTCSSIAPPRSASRSASTDEGAPAPEPLLPAEKTIVEHTAINPNKAAHIGHLRNTTLGDTLVRLLRYGGVPVEVQNYIDDTGVQVADVVVGFEHLEHKTLDEVRAIADSTRFDYYCWDLYARVTEWYDADRARLSVRSATLHAIEHGGNDTAALGAFVADRIVRTHLATMARLNVDYDLLTWEGDILRLKFWATAFDLLRESGTMFKQTEGKLAGCWVMPIEEDPTGDAGDPADAEAGAARGGAGEHEQREKVIVRSDGTVTYVGKDIAYQYLEARPAREGLPLPAVRHAPRRRHAVGDDVDAGRRSAGSAGVRPRPCRLQRDRHAPELPAEAAEAGAGHARPSRRGRALDPLLLRDGGAVAPHGAGAGLHRTGREQAVRRGVGPQGARREGGRSARSADRQGPRRGRGPQSGDDRRGDAADRDDARRVGGALLPRQVHAHQDDRLRHGRGAGVRGRERAVPAVLGGAGPEHLRQAGGARRRHRGRSGGAPRVDAGRRARARRRWRRPVGPGARSGAAGRGRRPGGPHAGTGGPRQVRLRPRAGVQRACTTASPSSTRSARRTGCGAPP